MYTWTWTKHTVITWVAVIIWHCWLLAQKHPPRQTSPIPSFWQRENFKQTSHIILERCGSNVAHSCKKSSVISHYHQTENILWCAWQWVGTDSKQSWILHILYRQCRFSKDDGIPISTNLFYANDFFCLKTWSFWWKLCYHSFIFRNITRYCVYTCQVKWIVLKHTVPHSLW